MNSYIKYINQVGINIHAHPTNIFGLSYNPQMSFSNDEDILIGVTRGCSNEISNNNMKLMDFLAQKYNTNGIVEIGVSRNGEASFTNILLKYKPDNVPYLGIDINNKSYLNNINKNIFTIQSDSNNQKKIRDYIYNINIKNISLLFIDGWHSLNTVINDWMYADLLSDNGVVVFHDTNYHPGPAIILDAIDNSIFRIEKYFDNLYDDYGMAVAYRL